MQGRAVHIADAQIGAIALVHGFTVATRDERPFEAMGVPFVNPWAQSTPGSGIQSL
jgi:predicted nucleic acid-binding protein